MKLFILMILFLLDASSSHKVSQGLSCVNDLVNKVSCTWHGSLTALGKDCRVSGVRIVSKPKKVEVEMKRDCRLKQNRNSSAGCSFVFENEIFNCFRSMPYIRMECDGTLVENITEYNPCDHIKMNPPGVPNVTKSANETYISWSKGDPSSDFLTAVNFEVQIKEEHQTWKDAEISRTSDKELKILPGRLKGQCQARVRVKPDEGYISHWSDWSPATSWFETTDKKTTPHDQSSNKEQLEITLVTWYVTGSLGIVLVVMLVLYRCCFSKGHHKMKPVPNPSRYFHTLYSVHEGNLKKWINPLSTAESFFTAQPCEQLSPVEVCDSSDVVPSTSPSSTSTCALLHTKSHSSAGSITREVMDSSSSMSSSCFSNMGYFTSSSPGSSAPTNPSPAYFTYQDDFPNLHGQGLHLSLCTPFDSSRVYESLKREPQSPDSGFSCYDDEKDEKVVDVKEEKESAHDQSAPLLLLPLHLPSQIYPSSFLPTPPPPNTPSTTLVFTESLQVDEPEEAAGESYAAWPLAGSMCRSSSMPVEPCRTGYLTLKELQTTFSNKSI
ncbi:interleukin-2 receptor subunit beta [Halichoeres trimaculatus]|uniref:interleukin-2 receptor subunit beta n=1 Tax=Halichoeres trimaculatus TaxID=147232 RepID=UPI003D9DD833